MLESLMMQKQLTISELARISGVKKSHVSRITRGITTDCKLSTVYKLATALECNPWDLTVPPGQ